MASNLALRSAARALRRSISDFAGKTHPTKRSFSTSSEFNTGHKQHIQQDCQPNKGGATIVEILEKCSRISRGCTTIMEKLDEHSRITRATREDLKFLLQQADENEAWDRLQKRVILPSAAIVALAYYAHKMLFGESRQEMPGEIKSLN